MRAVIVCSALALTLASCTEELPPAEQPSGPGLDVTDEGPVMPLDHPPVDGIGGGSGTTGGGTGSTGGGTATTGGGTGSTGGGTGVTYPTSAGTQRLTVAQLAGSMPVVLGGNTWMTNSTTQGFTARAATLGVPDYINVVDENLEPSALHLKFMGDAARDGCTRTANADGALAASSRVLMRFVGTTDTIASNASGVDENLRYLKLRFHGVKVQPSDVTSIAGLRTVFDSAVRGAAGTGTPTANHVKEGWRAVCVALLTAPEYHLY